jgi:hypothetical protein
VGDATSGIRLYPLEVRQRHIPVDGRLELEGLLVVDEPSETARLELSYSTIPEDRSAVLSAEDRAILSVYVRTVVPPGAELARPGRYRYHAIVDDNAFTGEIDVIVAAVDGETVLSDCWQQVTVGSARPEGFPTVHLEFEWETTPLT